MGSLYFSLRGSIDSNINIHNKIKFYFKQKRAENNNKPPDSERKGSHLQRGQSIISKEKMLKTEKDKDDQNQGSLKKREYRYFCKFEITFTFHK